MIDRSVLWLTCKQFVVSLAAAILLVSVVLGAIYFVERGITK